jgi:hypothetical protein
MKEERVRKTEERIDKELRGGDVKGIKSEDRLRYWKQTEQRW